MLDIVSIRRPRIALVEDDQSLRAALCFSLETDGYEVTAHAQAGSLLEGSHQLDCMVVDLKLPDMDGLTLIRRLREMGVAIPAILITTHPDQRCRDRAKAVGAEVVEKPLIGGELRRRIDALVS